MVLTNDLYLPTEEELTVPQEITLSTPWMKAVIPYMHIKCENEIKVISAILDDITQNPNNLSKSDTFTNVIII